MQTAWLTKEHFWQFSISLYSESNFAQQLLYIQDNYGANINLCLFFMYLDKHHVQLNEATKERLIAKLNLFNHEFTRPLRAIRYQLKKQQQLSLYPAIRQAMLDAELSLERQEQALLIDELKVNQLNTATTTNHFKHYLTHSLLLSKTDLDQTLLQVNNS